MEVNNSLKKILLLVIALTMTLSLVACGNKNTTDSALEKKYDTSIIPSIVPNNGDIVFKTVGNEESIPQLKWLPKEQDSRFSEFGKNSVNLTAEDFSKKFMDLFTNQNSDNGDISEIPYTVNVSENHRGGEFSITSNNGTLYLEKRNFYGIDNTTIVGTELVWGGIANTPEQVDKIISIAPKQASIESLQNFVEYCRNYFEIVGIHYTNSIERDFEIYTTPDNTARNTYAKARCYINNENYFCLELNYCWNNSRDFDMGKYNEHDLFNIFDHNLSNPFGIIDRFSSMEELVQNKKFLHGYLNEDYYDIEYPSKHQFVAQRKESKMNGTWFDIIGNWAPSENDFGGTMTVMLEGKLGDSQVRAGSVKAFSKLSGGVPYVSRFEDIMSDFENNAVNEENQAIRSHSKTTNFYGPAISDMNFYTVKNKNGTTDIFFTVIIEATFGGELATPI